MKKQVVDEFVSKIEECLSKYPELKIDKKCFQQYSILLRNGIGPRKKCYRYVKILFDAINMFIIIEGVRRTEEHQVLYHYIEDICLEYFKYEHMWKKYLHKKGIKSE